MASTGARKATKETRKVQTYRATAAEEKRIAANAEAAGMPRSTWIREAATRDPSRLAQDDRHRLGQLGDELLAIGINLNRLVRLAHRREIQSSRNFREVLDRLTAKLAEQRGTLDSVFGRISDS